MKTVIGKQSESIGDLKESVHRGDKLVVPVNVTLHDDPLERQSISSLVRSPALGSRKVAGSGKAGKWTKVP